MKEVLHIYCRVSTKSQTAPDKVSLGLQKKLGKKRAEDLGMDFKVWDERSASAGKQKLDHRPVMRDLLAHCEDGLVKHVYVYDPDRLSRDDNEASFIIRMTFKKAGVALYTTNGQIDLSNPDENLMFQMLQGFAHLDNLKRADRFRRSKLKAVQDGKFHGGAVCFGFMVEDKRLVPNPKEAKIVARMFEMYATGHSMQKIKTWLDVDLGVRAKRGGLWSLGSIRVILRNTIFIGFYEYRDKKEADSVTVNVPRIVDQSIWDAVQARS